MWPLDRFRRLKNASSVPDELLGTVQRGVLAAMGSLQQQIHGLAQQFRLLDESATEARKIESRLARCETLSTATRSLLEQEISRIDQAVAQLRGQATGLMRGPRRNRQAEDIGGALLEMLGPERAEQLVAELARRQNGETLGGRDDALA